MLLVVGMWGESNGLGTKSSASGASASSAPSSGTSSGDVFMSRASPAKYSFIPNDDTHDKNDGFCVVDTLLGVYGSRIKKLTKEAIISHCNHFYNYNPTDHLDSLDGDVSTEGNWIIEQGITPKGVMSICEKYHIQITILLTNAF